MIKCYLEYFLQSNLHVRQYQHDNLGNCKNYPIIEMLFCHHYLSVRKYLVILSNLTKYMYFQLKVKKGKVGFMLNIND